MGPSQIWPNCITKRIRIPRDILHPTARSQTPRCRLQRRVRLPAVGYSAESIFLTLESNISGNSKSLVLQLGQIKEGPIGDCLKEKERGVKISMDCLFKAGIVCLISKIW